MKLKTLFFLLLAAAAHAQNQPPVVSPWPNLNYAATKDDPTDFERLDFVNRGTYYIYNQLAPEGQRGRNIPNTRKYRATYADGTSLDIHVNPDVQSDRLAEESALIAAKAFGRVSRTTRRPVRVIAISYSATQAGWSGGYGSINTHTGSLSGQERDGGIEEYIIHEAMHSVENSDNPNFTPTNFGPSSSAWLSARQIDMSRVSAYAGTNQWEDFSETAVAHYYLNANPENYPPQKAQGYRQGVPNRLAYFDNNSGFSFKKGAHTEIRNYSFELGQDSWTSSGDQSASFIQTRQLGHLDSWLAHWKAVAYKTTTKQTAVNLPDGYYRASIQTRSSGGHKDLRFFVKSKGQSLQSVPIPTTSGNRKVEILNIPIFQGECEIGFVSDANAYNWAVFDKAELKPMVANHSFESGVKAWTSYGDTQFVLAQTVNSISGISNLAHNWTSVPYEAKTQQVIQSLPTGTYTASVWARSTGGQNFCRLFVQDYGGNKRTINVVPGTSDYVKIEIPNILVTNGKCTIGVETKANPGQWAIFDDFEFKLTSQSPNDTSTGTDSDGMNDAQEAAKIIISCDNSYTLKLNGNNLGSGSTWTQAQTFDLALQQGSNLIEVEGNDAGGVAALLADITVGSQRTGTNLSWEVSRDRRTWVPATEYGGYGVNPWRARVQGMPSDTPGKWIWSSNRNSHNKVYFRCNLYIGKVVMVCDDSFVLSVNGAQVGLGDRWNEAKVFTPLFKSGRNQINVTGTNGNGAAGLLADINIAGQRINTNSSWQVSLNQSSWRTPTSYGRYAIDPWYQNIRNMPNNTSAEWIWYSSLQNNQTVYFRSIFDLE